MDWDRLRDSVIGAANSTALAAAQQRYADRVPEEARTNAMIDLAESIEAVLREQPEFTGNLMLFTGKQSFQLIPPLARRLLRQGFEGTAQSAIDWLQRLLATEQASAIIILPVWGLVDIASPLELTPDISLVPLDQLPSSPQYEYLKRRVPDVGMATYTWTPPKVALVGRITVKPLLLRQSDGLAAFDETMPLLLNDICRCLTLVGPNLLIPGPEWIQFEDAEIASFAFSGGISTSGSQIEIQPAWLRSLGAFDGTVAAKLVPQYLALQGTDRARIQMAVERFHRAMRRHSAGDVAVEISIALDALLGDGAGELTWKVGLRAALLAGGRKPDRKERRAIVAAIYSLRSTVAHTGRVPPDQKIKGVGKWKVDELSQRGLVVAAEVVRAAITRGALPDWFDEELGPDQIVELADRHLLDG